MRLGFSSGLGVVPRSRNVVVSSAGGGGGGAFSPSDLSNLVLWLKSDTGVLAESGAAATDTDPVATWQDQSGEGNNFVQTLAGSMPLMSENAVNSLPAVVFWGNDDTMWCDSVLAQADVSFTIFFVCNIGANQDDNAEPYSLMGCTEGAYANIDLMWAHSDHANANRCYFGIDAGAGQRIEEDNWMATLYGSYHILTYRITSGDAGGQVVWKDGADSASNSGAGAAKSATNGKHWLARYGGSTPDTFSTVGIAEIIIYSDALSDADKYSVESYLSTRYNIPIP